MNFYDYKIEIQHLFIIINSMFITFCLKNNIGVFYKNVVENRSVFFDKTALMNNEKFKAVRLLINSKLARFNTHKSTLI